MKSFTLNFNEVEIDGLPEEEGHYLCVSLLRERPLDSVICFYNPKPPKNEIFNGFYAAGVKYWRKTEIDENVPHNNPLQAA